MAIVVVLFNPNQHIQDCKRRLSDRLIQLPIIPVSTTILLCGTKVTRCFHLSGILPKLELQQMLLVWIHNQILETVNNLLMA